MGYYLSVTLLQVVQTLRMGLLANVGFVDDEAFAPSLLSQQHTWMVTSQLWRGQINRDFLKKKITSINCIIIVPLFNVWFK